MANQYVNKVQLADGTPLIDISGDTVAADKLLSGYTAHDKSGAAITGTYVPTVNVTETQDSHGGTIVTISDVVTSGWFGMNYELVKTLSDLNWTLADTTYSSWTPSTTAGTIKAYTTWDTFTADMANYEYVIVADAYVAIEYADGTTYVPRTNAQSIQPMTWVSRRPNTYQRLVDKNYYSNSTSTYNWYLADYYNSSNTRAIAIQQTVGIYVQGSSVGVSSSTSDNPTITVRTPTVYAKCSTNYFSTDAANAVTGATITIKNGKVYRIDKFTNFQSAMNKRAIDFYGEMNPQT